MFRSWRSEHPAPSRAPRQRPCSSVSDVQHLHDGGDRCEADCGARAPSMAMKLVFPLPDRPSAIHRPLVSSGVVMSNVAPVRAPRKRCTAGPTAAATIAIIHVFGPSPRRKPETDARTPAGPLAACFVHVGQPLAVLGVHEVSRVGPHHLLRLDARTRVPWFHVLAIPRAFDPDHTGAGLHQRPKRASRRRSVIFSVSSFLSARMSLPRCHQKRPGFFPFRVLPRMNP